MDKNIIFFLQNLTTKLIVVLGYKLTQNFYLEVNFDKSTIELHFLLISYMLTKFLKKLKINIYIINKLFKLQIFVV